jgi:hypothetical protein
MFFELKYPGFFLAVSVMAVYFAVRYYFKGDEPGRINLITLISLKFIFLSSLILFIFDPVIKFRTEKEIRQRHILFFDNSVSVPLAGDRDSVLFRSLLDKFLNDDSFIFYRFGNSADTLKSPDHLDFKDNFSNISNSTINNLIASVSEKQNVRSAVVLTDGNFTDADNFTLKSGIPTDVIYGSVRTKDPDIFINDLDYDDNPAPGTGTSFTAVVGYSGTPSDASFSLGIFEKGKLIRTVKEKTPSPGSFISIKTEMPELNSDLRELEFIVTPLKNERNVYNNKKSAVQRLLTSSSSFLVVADTPSLDLTFFLRLLGSAGYSYDVFYSAGTGIIGGTDKYKALIVFSLPVRNSGNDVAKLAENFDSRLFFTTRKTDIAKLYGIAGGSVRGNIKFIPASGSFSEKMPDNGTFLLSRGNETLRLSGLPGIEYNAAFLPDEKLFTSLANAEGQGTHPVLFISRNTKPLTILAGFSSFWRLLFNDRDDNFSSFMLNIIDRAAVDASSERIRVRPSKPEYYSGEKVVLSGIVLDDNLRPARDAGPSLTVAENSLTADFTFVRNEWRAEFYVAEPGVYTARISSGEGDGRISRDVKFRILPNDMETSVTGADTLFLQSFARARNGRAVPLDSAEAFLSRRSGNSEISVKQTTVSLTRNLWFFIFLAALFIAELSLRKYKDLS